MGDWQGKQSETRDFKFQRNFVTNAKPEAGESEPFVRTPVPDFNL